MSCPRCDAAVPAVAHFCPACGHDLQGKDDGRTRSFAVRPNEPVASFAPVSTIMPRGGGAPPRTYLYLMGAAALLAVVTAVLGALPMALLVAVFAMPIIYIAYLYDVNLWEDEPLPVTLLAFVATFVLGLGFTWLWSRFLDRGALATGVDLSPSPTVTGVLTALLLVPVVGELIRQLGPVVLAGRPQFDDLMDGLTFGVVSGVAFASAETLVRHWSLLSAGFTGLSERPGEIATVLLLEGFVKPLLYGTATGLAVAEFSGLGRGHDGFTGRWLKETAVAICSVALYSVSRYLLSLMLPPAWAIIVTLLIGLLLLGMLVLRLRRVLHVGLTEAALESAARADASIGADGELDFCDHCEMPLTAGARFCSACGKSVGRTATTKVKVTA